MKIESAKITIIILLIFVCIFLGFANKILSQENKDAWEVADKRYRASVSLEKTISYIKDEYFEKGYNSAVKDIDRLFWCEDQSNPPIEKCIHVFLDKDYGNLPTINRN